MTSLRERLARTPPGYRYSIGRILAIYAGLMVTLLLAALDQTIVATALPRIVSDLGGLSSYSWVFTAYLLASTVTVPLYGKLGDIYGRRPLLLFAISIFLARLGALRAGAEHDRSSSSSARVQGLGAGGLFPLAIATVGKIVPPRDRGRYQGLIGAVFAAASIIGPARRRLHRRPRELALDLLRQPAGRRARAARDLPDDAAAVAEAASTRRLARGACVLALGTAALLLGLVWGGREYPWGSPQVVGALAASAVLLAVFALVERRVVEPILPFDLLRDRTVAVERRSAIGSSGWRCSGRSRSCRCSCRA